MTPNNLKNLDQSEVMTLCGQLQLHAGHLRGLVHTAEGALVSPPSLSSDIIGNVGLLESHITELETRLGGIAPAFQSASTPAKSTAAKPPGKGDMLSQAFTQHGVASAPELNTKLALDEAAAALAKAPATGIDRDCAKARFDKATANLAAFKTR